MSGQLKLGDEDRSAALRRIWQSCLELLAAKVSTVTFSSYVETAQPISYVGNVVTIGVLSPFAREWLEKKAGNAIRAAIELQLDACGLQVEFIVLTREQQRAAENAAIAAKKSEAANADASAQICLPLQHESGDVGAPGAAKARSRSQAASPRPIPSRHVGGKTETRTVPRPPIPCLPLIDRYVFEWFLTGRSNRLAHAGAMSVAARPSEVYNPLFLYGAPGLGKTHLLQGIAHALAINRPELRVAYVSGEFFAQSYITAIREHATEGFRRQYRDVDVWLVDDIQFVSGKEHTKEEFFHTFNSLYQSGRQIVIASDRSPRELNTMDERLRSRFQSGLVADIGAPELETRIAILQQCRQRENAVVSDDVIEYIGSAIQSNIRALEGALTRLIAYSSVMNVPATAELAQSVLGEYFIDKPVFQRKVAIDEIITAVGDHFGISPEAIKGLQRHKDVSLARQVAIYISRELIPELNTTLTGAAFGGRDHATIVYSSRRVKALRDSNPELKATIAELMTALSV